MDYKFLESAGLSQNESKVYFALVKLGIAPVSEIAKVSQVNRVNIYDVLKSLEEKGLIASIVKSQKRFYEAASPENVNKLLEEKENKILQSKKQVEGLLDIFQSSKNKQDIASFKSLAGIKTVLNKILEEKPSEILNFGSTGGLFKRSEINFDIWESKRENLKIQMKVITSKIFESELPKRKYQKIKFIEKEFNSITSTLVFGDNVAILVWTEIPLAVLISSKEAAESYRNYFYSLWDA